MSVRVRRFSGSRFWLAAAIFVLLSASWPELCLAGGATAQGGPTSLLLQAWKEGSHITAMVANLSNAEVRLVLGAGRYAKGLQTLGETPLSLSSRTLIRTTVPSEIRGARVETLFLRQESASAPAVVCNVIGIHPDTAGWGSEKFAFASSEAISFRLDVPGGQEGFWVLRQPIAGSGTRLELRLQSLPPGVVRVSGPAELRSRSSGGALETLTKALQEGDWVFRLSGRKAGQIVFRLEGVATPDCALLQFPVLTFQFQGTRATSGGMSGPRLLAYDARVMRLEHRPVEFSIVK